MHLSYTPLLSYSLSILQPIYLTAYLSYSLSILTPNSSYYFLRSYYPTLLLCLRSPPGLRPGATAHNVARCMMRETHPCATHTATAAHTQHCMTRGTRSSTRGHRARHRKRCTTYNCMMWETYMGKRYTMRCAMRQLPR